MHHNRQQFGIACLVVHMEFAIKRASIMIGKARSWERDGLGGGHTDTVHGRASGKESVGTKKGQDKVEMSPSRQFNCTNVWAQTMAGRVEMSRHGKKKCRRVLKFDSVDSSIVQATPYIGMPC